MKRPQGFERPATPAVPPTPAAPPQQPSTPKSVQKKPSKAAAARKPQAPAPSAPTPARTPAARPTLPRAPLPPQPSVRAAPARGEAAATEKPYTRAPRPQAPTLPTAWWMTKAAEAGAAVPEAPDAISPAAAASQHPVPSRSSQSSVTADAITEPIAVQPGSPASAAASSAVPPSLLAEHDSAMSGPLAPVTQLSTAVFPKNVGAGDESRHGREENPDAAVEGSELPLKPASARAKLRAATKARRSYERAEVRRFTRHLRRRRAVWLGSIGAALALALFVAVGTFSPLMALTTIQIEGATRLDPTAVSGALSGQLGTPLPLVDMGEVKEGLSQFSLIQSFATESRPPHTLVVRIVERDPIGAIAGANGFDLVDPAGVVIQTTPERPAGFPVAEVAGTEGLAAAGSVVQALPADIRAQLDVVRAASTDDVNLTLLGGATVAWGSAENSAQKALVLSKLMAAAPPGTVSVYDVSSPASPVVR